jgi:hypothetical protein
MEALRFKRSAERWVSASRSFDKLRTGFFIVGRRSMWEWEYPSYGD